MTHPCVYIVGAGPGDPSLISVRGLRILERADVVVYDHQVPRALLRSARPDAEQIDVGPAAPRTLDQEAISILLAEKVRDGKSVVRLKWGDPFVFDSGGKEALLLREQGIPFEIVPGVPAAIASAPRSSSMSMSSPACSRERVTTIRRPKSGRSSNQRRCSRSAATRPITNNAGASRWAAVAIVDSVPVTVCCAGVVAA